MTAAMSATPVATATANSSASSLSFSTTRSVAAGNTLIIYLGCSATTTQPTFTVTTAGGLTWTRDATVFNASNLNGVMFSAPVGSTVASSTTIVVSIGGGDAALGRWTGQILEATGILQSAGYTDLTATASGTSSSTTPSVTSATQTAQSDELLVGGFVVGAAPTFTQTAGLTLFTPVLTTAATSNKQNLVVYKVLSGATAVQTVGGTLDSAASWLGILATYKGAAPAPPSGTITVVAGAVATGVVNAGATSLVLTAGRTIPTGSTMILGLATGAQSSVVTFTVTDQAGNTWRTDAHSEVTSTRLVHVGSAPVTTALNSGQTVTVTCSASIGRWAAVIMEATGLYQALGYTDLVATGTANSTSPSATSGSVTTAQAAELVVGVTSLTGIPVFTQGSGYTLDPGATSAGTAPNVQVAFEHKIVSSAAAQTANGTLDVGVVWVQALVTFKGITGAAVPTGRWVYRSGSLKVIDQAKVLRSGSLV